ncbi:MAG: carboxyltransferase domain-containing protein [Micrococcus sp.]|nr:carboxyltransferase domain-containing protein [Micrococcus sp.]
MSGAPDRALEQRTVRRMGERSLLVECADLPAVMRLHARLTAEPLPHQRTAIAGAATVLVRFATAHDARAAIDELSHLLAPELAPTTAREATLDVVYDGEDLADVAAQTGLSVDAVIRAHTEAIYRGAFGGFAPGFVYCAADVTPFTVSRREHPRTAVPAGAVAVAGEFSAVYPRRSPGGWQLLGHTEAALWDVHREDPALLHPGDIVRYRAVRAQAHVTRGPAASAPLSVPDDGAPASGTASDATSGGLTSTTPALEVLSPGVQSLLQDAGRPGWADLGVGSSGAADTVAARAANQAVGNDPSEAVIETLLAGLRLRAQGEQVLALAGPGASGIVEDTGQTVTAETAFTLDDGATLRVESTGAGVRSYVALRGGLDATPVLGSRSHDVLSGLGPPPLSAGTWLSRRRDPGFRPVGAVDALGTARPEASRDTPGSAEQTAPDGVVHLRVLRGPRDDWFTEASWAAFTGQAWTVSPEANRVGVRLSGASHGQRLERRDAAELPSEAMVLGAVQVPPSGDPVVFLADHPVTGGYPVIAVVAERDVRQLAQAAPGTQVRFVSAEDGERR